MGIFLKKGSLSILTESFAKLVTKNVEPKVTGKIRINEKRPFNMNMTFFRNEEE
jgi:hypothetical protein